MGAVSTESQRPLLLLAGYYPKILRLARSTPPIPQLNRQPQPHLQRVGPVVVGGDGEVFELLEEQGGAVRAALETELVLGQVGAQAADTHLFVGAVIDAVERQRHALLQGLALELGGEELLELVGLQGEAVGLELADVLDAFGNDMRRRQD